MTGLELFLIYGAARLLTKAFGSNSSPRVPSIQTSIFPPEKIITFVGRTGAGKSSTANAVLGYPAFDVGATHGTTTQATMKEFRSGYFIQDTPGLLDNFDYRKIIFDAIKPSELVIYTTTGQLYRKELEVLQEILEKQQTWDNASNSMGKRMLALYVNQQDVREIAKPTYVRAKEEQVIREQVGGWIAAEKVFFGAAAPVKMESSTVHKLTI